MTNVVLAETSTLVDLLRFRGDSQADAICYTYLLDGENQEFNLSYGEFERAVRKVAVALQQHCTVGDRALLIYRPGIDFIIGYFGCLFAGVIAVPVYPPMRPADWLRFLGIAKDCQPNAICSTASLSQMISAGLTQFPEFAALPVICTDAVQEFPEEKWLAPNISSDHLAFLQYTSGSTGNPKGVMVSHKNLVHNEKLIHLGFSSRPDFNVVSWLPLYHDMGLIGGAIQPIYLGCRTVIMSPIAFLQKPFRWLQAISKYRANASGGPNFAYDLCVKRISDEQLETLDLSSWEIAFNGAEPIRSGTLERFVNKFSPRGFPKNSIYTCYGLAEATLFVTGSKKGQFPTHISVDATAIGKNLLLEVDKNQAGAKELVSSGFVIEQSLRIVNPDSLKVCSEFEAGEIWVKGDSVAKGYWNRPEATEETFNAYVADSQEGPFLRTGDIGFFFKDQLYVTGRLKELVIIDGRNHYPQDIEDTVQSERASVRRGCGAAFSVDVDGQEKLVLLQELERNQGELDFHLLAQDIRRVISENHNVQLHALVLIEYGSLLKTSSGKIRRSAMRDLYLKGELKQVFCSDLVADKIALTEIKQEEQVAPESVHIQVNHCSDLQRTITELLAPHISLTPQQIDVNLPFSHFGLDSRALIGLSGELEEKIGVPLPAHLFYNYPTVSALAAFLAGVDAADVASEKISASFDDGVAIIGMACRFPGEANSPEKFWQLLVNNVDAISDIPESRWNASLYYDADPTTPGKMNTKWGGFLQHVAKFDAEFFGISPREASNMDPQQRLLMETSWEALENASISPLSLSGSQTGVFIGLSANDYGRIQPLTSSGYAGAGNAFSISANRLSYFYDLHGPSVVVDTACSSSLVAIHQACNSLLLGEINVALAGAANLILAPEVTVSFSQNRMMAADGRCKTFDDSADGYVRSEGVGVVILKRLTDAERDGDPIVAVIRGSAVNQDGKTNGLTAPNGRAQEAVIKSALKAARCDAEKIQFVETHGTGTRLGDPIEIYALNNAYGKNRAVNNPVLLGAVKSNIGHLEAAAGLAGIIKTALCLHHQFLPGNLHLKVPNKQIAWQDIRLSPVSTNTQFTDLEWAGVSSFGFGGTNAHIILQRYEQKKSVNSSEDKFNSEYHFLALSARNETSLQSLVGQYSAYLLVAKNPFSAICDTANKGRHHFSHRLAVVANTTQEAARRIDEAPIHAKLKTPGSPLKTAFMFTGQGSQYVNMGRDLYHSNSLFRSTLDLIDELSKSKLDASILSVMYPDEKSAVQMECLISRTDYTQPILFAIEYALAQVWMSFGVMPQVVLGHSLGEFTAACIAGVFSLEDAFKLVCARGKLMQSLPEKGAMMAVFSHENDIREFLVNYSDQISIGAFNGPGQVVLSGNERILTLLAQEFEKRGIQSKALRVSHGFHSPLMQPIMQPFSEVAKQINYQTPRIPVLSNVTGRLESALIASANYWCAHVLSPVHFSQSMQELEKEAINIIIEIGPKSTLIGMGKRCLPVADIVWLPSMAECAPNRQTLLTSVGQLYCEGAFINFDKLNDSSNAQFATLPNYSFADTHFWFDTNLPRNEMVISRSNSAKKANQHPLLGKRLYSPRLKVNEYHFESEIEIPGPTFTSTIDSERAIRISLMPFVELASAAHHAIFKTPKIYIRNIQLHDFPCFQLNASHLLHTFCAQFMGNEFSLSAYVMESSPADASPTWKECASAFLAGKLSVNQQSVESLNRVRSRIRKELDVSDYFESTRESGLKYCTAAQPSLSRLWWSPNEVLSEVKFLEEDDVYSDGLRIRHSAIHACMQTMGAVCPRDGKGTYLPQSIDSVALFLEQGSHGWIHIALQPHTVEHQPVADISLYDHIGGIVAIFRGIHLTASPVTRGLIYELKEADADTRLHLIEALLEKHISRVLKANTALSKNTVLTDYGLDSVMAMEIQSRLESKLDISLNPTHFQRGATIYSLSKLVNDLFIKRYHLVDENGEELEEEQGPLVEIAAGDVEKTPLFFVHPVGGSIFRYYDVARYLGPQQPFYGLQSPAVAGIDMEFDSIEAMARYYLAAIRKRQAHGPYLLGGWSMGGIIAFEIARQLHEAGEDVDLLAIVDAIAPTEKRKGTPLKDHVFVLKLLALDLGISERNLDMSFLSSLAEEDGLNYVYATAIATEALPSHFSYKDFKKRTSLFRSNYGALNKYTAKSYNGSAIIFKAEFPFNDRRHISAALDWDDVVAEIAQVKTLPGDHFSIMHRSHVNILATYLRSALQNVRPKKFRSSNELDILPEKYLRTISDTVIRGLIKKSNACEASLIVDESHPYFFDHPLDHVSGILLIEAMSQLVERCVPSFRGKNAYIKHAKFTFNRFCEKHLPTLISLEKAEANARWDMVNVAAKQSGCSVCVGRLAIAANGMPKAGNAEIMRVNLADAKYLHKANAENVLISTPVMSSEKEFICRALPPTSKHLLAGGDEIVFSFLYWFEAARQFITYLSHDYYAVPFGSPMNLVSVEFSMSKPLTRGMTYQLKHRAADKKVLSFGSFAHFEVLIEKSDEVVGKVSLVAQVVDKKTYQELRYSEK